MADAETMTQPYAWTRYWCSREGTFRLSNDGFLAPMNESYRSLSSVKEFAEIAETPILVLLGEPGIGKTFSIAQERGRLEAEVAARGEHVLWPDLRVVDSTDAFASEVTSTPEFTAWVRGEKTLHLYLDALDECMLRVQTLGSHLMRALRNGPPDRLSLRLTCRTAEWKNELEKELRDRFGAEQVKVYELLPLTRADVALAVVAHGIVEDEFFDYVERRSAAALASRPVPLEFLIRCFLRAELPATQVNLYEGGCLTLCEESEHRTDTGLDPPLTATERLMVAKRLAAAMTFSARSTILLGRDDGDIPAEAVRLSEIAGGVERTAFSTLDVTESGVRDTLDTGLFTARAAKVLGWAHRTYAEYLAARYVSESTLTPAQILPLIVHPDDPERKLTPQLHGVAAWLTSLHPEIFDYVVAHEPELLVLSDVAIEKPADRARVVAALLDRKRSQQLARFDVLTLWKLRQLAHDGIAEQLAPILADRGLDDDLRRFAADIAEYTACTALVPQLTAISLDSTEDADVRVDAASALVRIGTEVERAALKPLLETPATTRTERWLVRLAIKATWPLAMSAEELFQTLDGTRRRLGLVADDFMLTEHVIETLRPEHLPAAVAWVLARVQSLPDGRSFRSRDALHRLEDAILVAAWHSNDDALYEKLAVIALEKVRRHEAFVTHDEVQHDFEQQLATDADRRRNLARRLLPLAAAGEKPISPWWLLEETRYVTSDDLDWLLERQKVGGRSEGDAELDAKIILNFANLTDPSVFERVCAVGAKNGSLHTRIEVICRAIPLDSEEARSAREIYSENDARSAKRAERRAARERLMRPLQIAEWLQEAEKEPHAFWRLAEELSRVEGDAHGDLMALDIRAFPGWIAADASTQRRIVDVAERFVRESDCNADSWFGTPQVALAAIGGVRALMLLKYVAHERFRSLPPAVWQTWTPALLGAPNNDATVPLLDVAYSQAPDEVIRRVQQLVRLREAYVVHKLGNVLDEALTRGIVDVLDDDEIPTETLARALEPLLHVDAARMYAERLLANGSERSVIAAASLLLYAPNESWVSLWPSIAGDATFGRAVIERAVDSDRMDATPVYTLTEPRVAELYLWLCQQYPPESDVVHDDVYSPDTRDIIASWRSRCIDSLKNRGTRVACEVLRDLAQKRPEQTYLAPLVIEAEAIRRAKSWQPTPIAVLRQLVSDARRRQVRSETELADVLVESLGRLQQKLQGETPAAVDLWNTGVSMRPKTENELSNYIARHFRADLIDRGVVVGREVEIRPTIVPGSGERTDIHVDVKDASSNPVITVIVEAKGCWNRGVVTDLAEQLAHRYLAENHTRTGVYLVGWYQCAAWDDTDRRKATCVDAEPLEAALSASASELRKEGLDIRPVILDCLLRSGAQAQTSDGSVRPVASRKRTRAADGNPNAGRKRR